MKRIKRKLTGAFHSPVTVDLDVPDGLTPAVKSLDKDERETFWNDVIDETKRVLMPTETNWLATVPMSGGHGSMHLEARNLLGADYLHAVSSWQRAYVMLRLLGKDQNGTDPDHWHAKEFRFAAARWFDAFDVYASGMNIAAVTAPGQRWTLLLAALLDLAYGSAGTVDQQYGATQLYEFAAERCRDSKTKIELIAPTTGQGTDAASMSEQTFAAQWDKANKALAGTGSAPEMLARVTLRVLSQRLFVELPDQDVRGKRFFAQWIEVLNRDPEGRDVLKCLQQLRQFGGNEPLDPGPEFPEIFRPYRGWCAPPLEDFKTRIASDDVRDKVISAYKHAVEIVDRLMDLLLAQAHPRVKGAGFDRWAYGYLRGRMNTTRNQWNREDVKADQRGSFQDRVQFQRLLVELANKDERTIQRAAEAWRDAAASVASKPHYA